MCQEQEIPGLHQVTYQLCLINTLVGDLNNEAFLYNGSNGLCRQYPALYLFATSDLVTYKNTWHLEQKYKIAKPLTSEPFSHYIICLLAKHYTILVASQLMQGNAIYSDFKISALRPARPILCSFIKS